MTKSELIARVAERYPHLVAKDADYAVNTILDAMAQALAAGHRIEMRGFGSFALNIRPPRIGRNPKSGEKVLVPEKCVPHFKAGKELRELVDLSLGPDAGTHAVDAKTRHSGGFSGTADASRSRFSEEKAGADAGTRTKRESE